MYVYIYIYIYSYTVLSLSIYIYIYAYVYVYVCLLAWCSESPCAPSARVCLPDAVLRSVLIISTRRTSNGGPQIPEPVPTLPSKRPLKVQISQGLGPFLQIELLKTGSVQGHGSHVGRNHAGGFTHTGCAGVSVQVHWSHLGFRV